MPLEGRALWTGQFFLLKVTSYKLLLLKYVEALCEPHFSYSVKWKLNTSVQIAETKCPKCYHASKLQHLAVGGSLNKLDFPRIVPGNTSVDPDIQFLWLSNCMHIGNICYQASQGCTCLVWIRRTGGMLSWSSSIFVSHSLSPLAHSVGSYSSAGRWDFLVSFRISPLWDNVSKDA